MRLKFVRAFRYVSKRSQIFKTNLNVSKGYLILLALNKSTLTDAKRNKNIKIKYKHLILIEIQYNKKINNLVHIALNVQSNTNIFCQRKKERVS